MRKREGTLFVISGPSGTGKGTICDCIIEKDEDAELSISATTRMPRGEEKNGEAYYFMSREEFDKKVEAGGFLEYATVFGGNSYGTPKAEVEENLKAGKDVILEIDVQGAMQIKKNFKGAVLIFIEPPSMDILGERLRNRGTETEEKVKRRLAEAEKELTYIPEYNYSIVNDRLQDAVDDACAIMRAEHLKVK